MKVCKFGGSSVADASQIKKVKSILDSDKERTIVVVSAPGKIFKNALESGLEDATPYDASAYMYISPEDKARDIEKSLQLIGIKFDKDDKVAYFNEYKDDKKIKDVITTSKDIKNSESLVYYVKVSDYNKLRELNNEKPINLKENEVLITSNFSRLIPSRAYWFLIDTQKLS